MVRAEVHQNSDSLVRPEGLNQRLVEAKRINQASGVSDFFIETGAMVDLVRTALHGSGVSRVTLNRPQVGNGKLLHRVQWGGFNFTAVSARPILVG